MKLSVNIALDAVRQKALIQIDQHAGAQLAGHVGLNSIYSLKLAQATEYLTSGTTNEQLVKEAEIRALTMRELCELILARNEQAKSKLSAYEAERQIAKRRIINEQCEQGILAAVQLFGAQQLEL